ncbi:hypothetical protein D3875_06255 [Deinococcus cavernae]|uniref:Uncharacterized protein n=1 Tax=Deinococcus cavernae TaxID=2320857 RepID=A0A418V545_9DEIO|nr:hypothetical protein [Deinococcus cavernae]RJF71233.1 hypothetical protein D3875_06255 [Deinococcus cavernae]
MGLIIGVVFIVLVVALYSALTEMANARRRSSVLDNVAGNVAVKPLSPAVQLAALTLELPDPQRQQAFGLLCVVQDALTSGRYAHDQRTQYLLQQTLDTYLPDTLRAYLDLTPGAAQQLEKAGQPARQLLSEQLSVMTSGVEQAMKRDHAAADRLLGQGNFLREKFGAAQTNEELKIR